MHKMGLWEWDEPRPHGRECVDAHATRTLVLMVVKRSEEASF